MIIERILIISLLTIGYCCTFWPGMIFERVGDWMETHLPEWVNKPLWSCYVCCCFWVGTGVYWCIWHISFIDWLMTVIPAMGLNAVISELTNKTEKVEIKDMPDVKITYDTPSNAYTKDNSKQDTGFFFCEKCQSTNLCYSDKIDKGRIKCSFCDSYIK